MYMERSYSGIPLPRPYALRYSADSFRDAPTGAHARIKIMLDGVTAAYDSFNFAKGSDRTWVVNKAWKRITTGNNPLKDRIGVENFALEFDFFCENLWEAWNGTVVPVRLEGNEEPEGVNFVLQPYIIEGGGTIVFGPPGTGKSFSLLLMAVSIDAGIRQFWKVGLPKKTLFVNLERSEKSIKDRLGAINRILGLPATRPLDVITARGQPLEKLAISIRNWISENGTEVLFLDSISRAGAGDLNANEVGNKIIDQLNRLCPTWLALGHTPRNDPSHLYGSIHFEAGADIVVKLVGQVSQQTSEMGLGMVIEKENDIGKWPMTQLALSFNNSGLIGVRKPKEGEFTVIEEERNLSLMEEIVSYLRRNGKASATKIATETGRSRPNISSIIKREMEQGKTFVEVEKRGAEILYGLLGNVYGRQNGQMF